MYLEENYYLHKSGKVNDEEGAIKLLKDAFSGIEFVSIQGSRRNAVVSAYLYLGHYITLPELASLIGPYFSNSFIYTRFTSKKHQANSILSYNFDSHDLGAMKAYCMTKDGFSKFLGLIGGSSWLTQLPTPPKIRRQSSGGAKIADKNKDGCSPLPLTATHDYALGITLLSFLNIGLPFAYDKEFMYVVPRSRRKDKGSLCVDACIRIQYGRFRDVFVEQDMSTEPVATLTSKLCLYKELGVANKDNCVLFSVHCPTPAASGPFSSIPTLTKILSRMKEENVTLLELYKYIKDSDPLLDSIKSLLNVIGLGPYGNFIRLYTYQVGTPAPEETEGVDFLAPIAEYWEYEYGKKVLPLFPGDFSVEDLERYISDLRNHTNPYLNRMYDMYQIQNTFNRFIGVCAMLTYKFNRGDYYASDLRLLLSGYHAYMLPSILVANKGYLFHSINGEVERMPDCELNRWRRSVEQYFPGIMESKYSSYSPAFNYSSFGDVFLRHCFRDNEGHLICFEQVGCDLGAYLRCWAITCAAYQGNDFRVHLVCVCDTVDEALHFARNTESFNDSKWFDRSAPFTVSFLFPAMIDRERDFCPLFVFPRNQPRPEPIFSPEMEKGLRGAYEKARNMDKYIKDTSIQILREKVAKRKLAAQREKEKRAKEQKEEELSETMSLEEAVKLLNMCDRCDDDDDDDDDI